MSVLVAFTVGLVAWIVMWSLGIKAFDAFLVTIALTLVAATAHIMSPFIKRITRP